jgi:murein DD-endopeptidase MepM/ murein hydrolase activator NlpD
MNAQPPATDLAGDWLGTLGSGAEKLRLKLHVTKTFDGLYIGKLVSIDQGNGEIPLGRVLVDGRSIALEIPVIGATFKGELNPNGTTLAGKWMQGETQPLTFRRSGPAPATPPKEADSPSDASVDVIVPEPPIPFRGADGQSHLLYELHVTNFSRDKLRLRRIEILGDRGPIASFEGRVLLDILTPVGIDADDTRTVGPGHRVVAFLSLSLMDDPPPANLRHRLTFAGATLDLAPIAVSESKPIVIGPPLAGSDWLAMNGPGGLSEHRRALLAAGGHVVSPQRFAIDWFQLKTADAMFTGNPRNNRNYKAYGAEVLAVADATVAQMKDGIPDNTPGEVPDAADSDDAELGNYLMLDLGGGNYCLYAHLQPGSLRVKAGDRVKRGQTLGLLGNSGSSTAPHLHFQVMNGTSLLDPEGVPYLIDSFELLSGRNAGRQTDALPMENMRVKFGPVIR